MGSRSRADEWEPDGGVASVYFEIDPGDRGEGWRIALKDELEATCFAGLAGPPASGVRSGIGFLESAGGREIWTSGPVNFGASDGGPTRQGRT